MDLAPAIHEPHVVARFQPGGAAVVDRSREIALLQAETPRVRSERGAPVHGFGNTHDWLDPDNARPITAAILDGLARLARCSQAMARKGIRAVVVHETWPCFARRFGLGRHGRPRADAGPAAVARLARRPHEAPEGIRGPASHRRAFLTAGDRQTWLDSAEGMVRGLAELNRLRNIQQDMGNQ